MCLGHVFCIQILLCMQLHMKVIINMEWIRQKILMRQFVWVMCCMGHDVFPVISWDVVTRFLIVDECIVMSKVYPMASWSEMVMLCICIESIQWMDQRSVCSWSEIRWSTNRMVIYPILWIDLGGAWNSTRIFPTYRQDGCWETDASKFTQTN